MKVVCGKTLSKDEQNYIYNLSKKCDITYDTARLLFYRNIDTQEKISKFLRPSKSQFYNPYIFKEMDKIVERVRFAKNNGETILVCGDYDTDGVCATAIMIKCLNFMGIKCLYTIPERDDGYGLDLQKIEDICSDEIIDLIITVDCGISEKEKIDELLSVGIDVIVTDHHEPPEILPDCPILNPKVEDSGYPFDGLCGASVAYKLAYALIGEKANDLLDFVALATVADSMELIDENRALVFEGLKIFNSTKCRTAFKYLLNDNVKQITSQTLAYNVAPRINAGGRMGDANSSIKLFVTDALEEIYSLACKLNEYNLMRQAKCEEMYLEAKEIILKNKICEKKVLLVANENWSTGFIGIVAAKLVEDYNKPVIVFAGHDGYLKGSARSLPNVNIYNAINACKEFLIGFGGHSQAAGVSLEKCNFDAFYHALSIYLENVDYQEKDQKEISVEWKIDKEFSLRFAREINMLEPFGVGNKKPLFSLEVNQICSQRLRKNSPHFTFKTDFVEILDFNGESNVENLILPSKKTLIFEPNYSVFRDKEQVKGYLKNIILEENSYLSNDNYVFRNELIKIVNQPYLPKEIINLQSKEVINGNNRIYVASCKETVSAYNLPEDFKIFLFNVDKDYSKNCIVVSPNKVPNNFNKIIYLDRPISFLDEKIAYVNNNFINPNVSKLLSDRSVFSEIYSYLCKIEGKTFYNSAYYVQNNELPFDDKQFIYSTEVFIELGIFYIEDGVVRRNLNVKNALTNSRIYNRICNMVEGL